MAQSLLIPADNHTDDELFYTVNEIAVRLKIGRTTIFDELRLKRLKSVKIGRSRRIPAEWLKDYCELLKSEALLEE